MSIAAGIDRLLGDTEEAGRKASRAKERALAWSIQAHGRTIRKSLLGDPRAVK